MDADKARRRSQKVFAEFVESQLIEINKKIETKIVLGSREIRHIIPNSKVMWTAMSQYYKGRKKDLKLVRIISEVMGIDVIDRSNWTIFDGEINLGYVVEIELAYNGFGTEWGSGYKQTDDSEIIVTW